MSDTKVKCAFVHCFDPRFPQAFKKLLKRYDVAVNECDEISIGGGAGDFVGLERELEKSSRLHHPEFVLLTVHENCGAGAKEEDLEKAKEIAAKYFTRIETVYVTLAEAEEARK